MVECDLAKVEVAGSNPVSRSRIQESPASAGLYSLWTFRAYPAKLIIRAVPKW